MPWGAHFHALSALRVAAAASLLFWLGLLAFVAAELLFDNQDAVARSWLAPLDDALIFTVWLAACVATAACLLAMRAEWRRLALYPEGSTEAARTSGVAAAGEGGRCSAL